MVLNLTNLKRMLVHCQCFDGKNIDNLVNDRDIVNLSKNFINNTHHACVCVCVYVRACSCMVITIGMVITIDMVTRTLTLKIYTTKNYIYFVKSLEYVSSTSSAVLPVTMVMCIASFFEGKKLATPARIPLGIAGEL